MSKNLKLVIIPSWKLRLLKEYQRQFLAGNRVFQQEIKLVSWRWDLLSQRRSH